MDKLKIAGIWMVAAVFIFILNMKVFHSEEIVALTGLAIIADLLFIDIFRDEFPKYVYWIALFLITLFMTLPTIMFFAVASVIP